MENHHEFAAYIERAFGLGSDGLAISSGPHTYDWGQLSAAVARFDEIFAALELDEGAPIGVLAHTSAPTVAALLSILTVGRCFVTINPIQAPDKIAKDLLALRLPVVVAATQDLAKAPIRDALVECGGAVLEVGEGREITIGLARGHETPGGGPHHDSLKGVCILMQSSGTTGDPKRIPLKYSSFLPAISDQLPAGGPDQVSRKTKPVIVAIPIAHIGGLFHSVKAVVGARPQILMARFNVDQWAVAVRKYEIGLGHLVPAAVKMIYDAGVPPGDLASLKAIICGTGPLHPELQQAFEARYGVPILLVYGATEFAGGVASWSLDLHKEFMPEKAGSVGRVRPGVELRIVDAETTEQLAPGSTGLLQVKSVQSQNGPDAWVQTTDLAALDADRFLWIKGRADAAINRGGFKIVPGEVESVLMQHPGVAEAVVIGQDDNRLGQVPVAAVVPETGVQRVSTRELEAHARRHLTKYQIPVAFLIVDELPRTSSMKPNLPAVKALFDRPAKAG